MQRVKYLLALITLVGVLCLLSQPLAQDAKPRQAGRPQDSRVRSVSNKTADDYANFVEHLLKVIHRDFHFEAIPTEALAGRALLGLYRAGSIMPPDALAREPDRYFLNAPGKDLTEKLKIAREAVGDTPLIAGERGIHASMQAVFRTLDVFSNYTEVDAATRTLYEQGAGIGLYLEDKPMGGSYFVRNIVINSLAHKAGVRPGDELLEVDGSPIAPNTNTAHVNMLMTISARKRDGVLLTLRSLDGTRKSLKVSSTRPSVDNGEQFFTLEYDRDTPIHGYRFMGEDEWDFWVDYPHRIAMIRLGSIQSSTQRIFEIIELLRDDGLKGLVLDLRECPSGVPDSSAELAGYFLERNALIARTNYRNKRAGDDYRSNDKDEYRAPKDQKHNQDLPLVVLVGPDTSGAAELIAAALQDHERCKIVGQRTRGKSTIQNPGREDNFSREPTRNYGINYSFRLTVGVFMRPSGKNLHRLPGSTIADDWGVRPDVDVVLPAQMRRQVRAWWFEHDTRPVDTLDPTKIDDWRNDPVLATGVRLLIK